jgi:hypothetical protein
MAKIFGFLNYFIDAQSSLPMGVNVEFMFLVFTTDNGLKIFFLALHPLSSQSNSSLGERPTLPMRVAPEAMVGYL